MKLTKKLFLPGALLLACVLTLINSGCKKVSDLNPAPQSNADTAVYVLGYTDSGLDTPYTQYAMVWKNGVAAQLPALPGMTSTNGHAIAVSGSDVYVVGLSSKTVNNSIFSYPLYWKNGVATQLDMSANRSYATAIAVSGNDVYIAANSDDNAGYWKNGVFTSLADPANYNMSNTKSIAVSGSDVYVCGNIYLNNSGGQKAVYWKNGVLHALTEASKYAMATKICIQNNDVYVVYNQVKNDVNIPQAHYSKNGVDVQLSTDLSGGYVNDLLVNGNDVYIVGYISAYTASGAVSHQEAVVWKNNVVQTLFDGGTTEFAQANAIAVFGNNVYVSGQAGDYAGYWKNGVFVKLTQTTDYWTGVAVMAKSNTP